MSGQIPGSRGEPARRSGSARGQPLVALIAVLVGWGAARTATWTASPAANAAAVQVGIGGTPSDTRDPVAFYQSVAQSRAGELLAFEPAAASGGPGFTVPGDGGGDIRMRPVPERWLALRLPGSGNPDSIAPASADWSLAMMPRHDGATGQRRLAAGTALPAPWPAAQAQPAPTAAGQSLALPRRWSMDAWALFRGDDPSSTASAGLLPAGYGGSQSGAVLRYRLGSSSGHRLSAYLRTTSALAGVQDAAVALGLSARPVPTLPVVAAVEGRLADQDGRRHLVPAAIVYTELPPLPLPARMRATGYLQAGYAGGPFATPFADGQMVVDRPLLRIGPADLRAGGGVWGGGQRHAARLDAGPSLSLAMPLGRRVSAMAAVDWRVRLAGHARPGSGPVVTLSAGF